jgi:ADP-heptose:LPS heptosyltransferase
MSERRAIALIRLDGLGDALICVPALEGLRRAMPDAQFGVVCSPANEALWSTARVSHTYLYRRGDDVDAIGAQLRSAGYAWALVATEEPAGYLIARASGARSRAGFWHGFEKPFKSLWQYAQLTHRIFRRAANAVPAMHEVEAVYPLALAAGAQLPIPRDPSDLRAWLDVDPGGALARAGETLAVQISPKLMTGDWGPAAVARTIGAVLAASGFEDAALYAAPSHEGLGRAVMEQLGRIGRIDRRVTLIIPESMSKWLGALGSARAVITPDTGAAHAAGILGVPVVDLFDADAFETQSCRWKPWASPSRCLIKPPYSASAESELTGAIVRSLQELSAQPGVPS